MVSAIFTPTHIFCDFLWFSVILHFTELQISWLTYFNPPDPSSGPTSSPTPWRRQRDEVLAVSNRFCCSSADKTLGRSTWDLQGLGMAWDVEISCIFLHGPKLSEFTLQKHEQVYSVHFVWTWIPTLKRSQWCSGHVELILLIPSSETREQLTRFCHLQCLD
jgi:hypothetical protein